MNLRWSLKQGSQHFVVLALSAPLLQHASAPVLGSKLSRLSARVESLYNVTWSMLPLHSSRFSVSANAFYEHGPRHVVCAGVKTLLSMASGAAKFRPQADQEIHACQCPLNISWTQTSNKRGTAESSSGISGSMFLRFTQKPQARSFRRLAKPLADPTLDLCRSRACTNAGLPSGQHFVRNSPCLPIQRTTMIFAGFKVLPVAEATG